VIPSQRKPYPEEEWRKIEQFSEYSVSDTGLVRNDETGYWLTGFVNQSGVLYVGLTQDRKQRNRSVALLVAEAFLPPHKFSAFDTPIHLDGDKTNSHVRNLMWRPRWFAVKYQHQFHDGQRGPHSAVEEVETGEHFDSSWDAVMKYGLWNVEVIRSTIDGRGVWPTHQQFRRTHTIPRQTHGL